MPVYFLKTHIFRAQNGISSNATGIYFTDCSFCDQYLHPICMSKKPPRFQLACQLSTRICWDCKNALSTSNRWEGHMTDVSMPKSVTSDMTIPLKLHCEIMQRELWTMIHLIVSNFYGFSESQDLSRQKTSNSAMKLEIQLLRHATAPENIVSIVENENEMKTRH